MAFEALERRAALGAPIAIVAPTGVDPVPYLARVHVGGARGAAPLVLVDATSVGEHDPARWVDPSVSPLALADGGMLVLLDGAALPLEVQRLVARASAEARAPWERPDRLDLQLALTAVEPPEALLAAGRLDPALAARLADACASPIHLPRLQERPEDFRALLMDRLAREGLRTRGRPVGIEPAAYAKLTEYPFPGEDTELVAVVQRLVARASGDAVTRADVDAILESASPAPRSGAGVSRPGRVKGDGRDSKRRKDPISA
jgi:DNA-binding NtrC family response regulator